MARRCPSTFFVRRSATASIRRASKLSSTKTCLLVAPGLAFASNGSRTTAAACPSHTSSPQHIATSTGLSMSSCATKVQHTCVDFVYICISTCRKYNTAQQWAFRVLEYQIRRSAHQYVCVGVMGTLGLLYVCARSLLHQYRLMERFGISPMENSINTAVG